MLEIPVSLTSNDKYLKVDYEISSPKIELVVLQSAAENRTKETVRRYGDQYKGGGWSNLNFPLDSDVQSIQLVARKIGVTTDVEYVIVGVVEVIENPATGNMLLMHCTIGPQCLYFAVIGKHPLGAWRAVVKLGIVFDILNLFFCHLSVTLVCSVQTISKVSSKLYIAHYFRFLGLQNECCGR